MPYKSVLTEPAVGEALGTWSSDTHTYIVYTIIFHTHQDNLHSPLCAHMLEPLPTSTIVAIATAAAAAAAECNNFVMTSQPY
jgi:hypothetical protein